MSFRTKSEEKLPLDNILLFLLFEIARSYNLFNMTAFSCENPKHRNTEYRSTEEPTLRRVENTEKSWYQLPKLETEYYIILLSCHVILIYHIALIHHIILIYFVLISYTLITIIHYPGIISHHADIMLYCVVTYHMIRIFQLLIQYHTYISKPRQ